MRENYVDLNRAFEDIAEDQSDEQAIQRSYFRRAFGRPLLLDDLLVSPCTVVLAEAGSGKTWEMEAAAERLSRPDRPAFFVRIEDLAAVEIISALTPSSRADFDAWATGSSEAVFLLDSVDEARLRDPGAFRRALSNIVRALSVNVARCRFVITSRISEWRGNADRELLFATIPRLKESQNAFEDSQRKSHDNRSDNLQTPPLRVVTMVPLDESRIKRLASARGINDVERFHDALIDNDLERFAGRPKDVDDLISFWQTHGRFGPLTEMIEYNVDRKIEEPNPDRLKFDPLAKDKARRGAERLAAATILTSGSTFWLPDDHIDPMEMPDAIDPAQLLRDWRREEQSALLGRSVFDEATYGRVRFHHRSVVEYLAASWFRQRLREGCPPHVVTDLLFRRQHGTVVCVPSLAPIAGWLAGWNSEVFNAARLHAPQILLSHGDARALPATVRATLLGEFASRYADREHVDTDADYHALARFSDPDLSDTIIRLLQKHRDKDGVRIELLRIVWHGRMTKCADVALSIVLDDGESDVLRSYALRAVGTAGTLQQRQNIIAWVQQDSQLGNQVFWSAIDAIYPGAATSRELISALETHALTNAARTSSSSWFTLEDVIKRETSDIEIPDLVAELTAAIQRYRPTKIEDDPHGQGSVAESFSGLLVEAVRRLKELNSRDGRHTDQLAAAASVLMHLSELGVLAHHAEPDFKKFLEGQPAVRRALFWHRIQKRKDSEAGKPVNAFEAFLFGNWAPSDDDLDWMLDDSLHRTDEDDRRIAFEAACEAYRHSKNRDAALSRLRTAASGNPQREAGLAALLAPPSPEVLQRQRDLEEERQRDLEKERGSREDDCEYVRSEINNIRSGQNLRTLFWLVQQADREGRLSQFSKADWRVLIAEFGEDLAEAVRSGAKVAWRTYRPLLRHEIIKSNTIEGQVIVGLAGLTWEFQDGLDFASLSSTEADRAVRYALQELNGFPPWLPTLVTAQPDTWKDIVKTMLEAEFAVPVDKELIDSSFDRISYGETDLVRATAPLVLARLGQGEPANLFILDATLRIIERESSKDREAFERLAAARTPSLKNDTPRFVRWLTAWMIVTPLPATEFLQTLRAQNGAAVKEIVSKTAGSVYETMDRRLGWEIPPSFSVPCLRKLIPIVYESVSPNEDEEHVGVYTPSERDRAREFRGWLITQLRQIPGKATYDALLELANQLELGSSRDFLLDAARERAELDAECPPWSVSDVLDFERNYETDPKTTNELLAIVTRRIEAIRQAIEQGDFSERGLFNAQTDEVLFQKWMAQRLREVARDRYTVSREEEVDRFKKPDIRVRRPGLGTICIEAKCAHKWSYNELLNALSDQLARKYLKDVASRHGILLLANMEKGHTWKPGPKSKLGFLQVVTSLSEVARDLARQREDIDELSVIGIDFT